MNKEERMYELLKHRYDKKITTVNLFEDIEALLQENEQLKEVIDKVNVFLNNHDKNAGKLYYKYNNKYLLSEIKKDIRNILKEVSDGK